MRITCSWPSPHWFRVEVEDATAAERAALVDELADRSDALADSVFWEDIAGTDAFAIGMMISYRPTVLGLLDHVFGYPTSSQT